MRIFRDPEKLNPNYIPEKLPHREKNINELVSFFHPGLSTVSVQVIGPAGVGKTSVSISAGRLLKRRGLKTLYVNLKIMSSKLMVYNSLIEQLLSGASTRSMRPEELYVKFLKIAEKTGGRYLIILDEVSYFIQTTGDTSIVYELTRINELSPFTGYDNIAGIIFIARDYGWRKMLDSSERSSLGNLIVKLDKYSVEQLVDIIHYRASQAFKRGVMPLDVIEYIAELTYNEANSDVRYALDLLLYAGTLAENRGDSRVTLDHVREVVSKLSPYVSREDIINLTKSEKLALLALAYALKGSSEGYVSFTDVVEMYEDVCREFRVYNCNIKKLERALQNLISKAIVVTSGLRLTINVPTDKLIGFVENLIDQISQQI